MDDEKDIDPNLTSTINDSLLSRKNDKTDANDSTPTSSTDAASIFPGTSSTVSEDPISSTSSDVMEKDKILNSEKGGAPKNLLVTEGDVDLLDMNITNVSSDLISEDVEDIVQDLENLLGEPEPQHDFLTRRKEKSTEEKDPLTSLENPIENIESTLDVPLSNVPPSDDAEVVHIPDPNTQQPITENTLSTDNESSTRNTESPVEVEESKTNICPPEISEVEKSETPLPGTVPKGNETNEDEKIENEAAAVSSSEIVTLPDNDNRLKPPNTVEVELSQDSVNKDEDCAEEISQSEIVHSKKLVKNETDGILEPREGHTDRNEESVTDETSAPQEEQKTNEETVECVEQNPKKFVGLVDYESDDDMTTEESLESNDKMQNELGDALSAPSKTVNEATSIVEKLTGDFVVPPEVVNEELSEISNSGSVGIDANSDGTQEITESEISETIGENTEAEISFPSEENTCEEIKNVDAESEVMIEEITAIEEGPGKEAEVLTEETTSVEEVSKGESEVLIEEISTSEGSSEGVSEVLIEEITSVEEDTEKEQEGLTAVKEGSKDNLEEFIEETTSSDGGPKEESEVMIEEITTVGEGSGVKSEILIKQIPEVEEDSNSKTEVLKEDIPTVVEDPEEKSEVALEEICPVPGKSEKEAVIEDKSAVQEDSGVTEVIIEDIVTVESGSEKESEVLIEEVTSVEEAVAEIGHAALDISKQSDEIVEVSDTEQNVNIVITSPPNTGEEIEDTPVSPSALVDMNAEQEVNADISAASSEKTNDQKDVEMQETLEKEQLETATEDDKEEKLETAVEPQVPVIQSDIEEHSEISAAETCPDIPIEHTVELTQKETLHVETTLEEEEPSQSPQEEVLNQNLETESSVSKILSPEENEEKVYSEEQSEVQKEPREELETQCSTSNEELGMQISEEEHQPISEQADKMQQYVEDEQTKHTEEVSDIGTVENESILSSIELDVQNSAEIECSVVSQEVEELKDAKIQSSDEKNQNEDSVALEEDSENLTPVIEEICVKKVIIYEHDCDSHSTSHKNITEEEKLDISPNVNEQSKEIELEKTEQLTKNVTESPVEETVPEEEKTTALSDEISVQDVVIGETETDVCISDQPIVQSDDFSIQNDISIPNEIAQSSLESKEVEEQIQNQCQDANVLAIETISEENCKTVVSNSEHTEHLTNIKIVTSSEEILELSMNSEERQQQTQHSDDFSVIKTETNMEPIADDVKPDLVDITPSSDEKNMELNETYELEEIPADNPVDSEENMSSNQRQEVSSSDQQIVNKKRETTEFDKPCHPTSTLMTEIVIESPQSAKEINSAAVPEQAIEDQTSAAVQSILDNMLSEENRMERILEKEEMPVVHSSYSSYEVQKAVQEIQGITQTEVEISPEVMESISNSEKHDVSGKSEFVSDSFEGKQVEDNQMITPQILENMGDVHEDKEVQSYVEQATEIVETIPEIINSPINNEITVTQSSNDKEEEKDQICEVVEESPSQSKEESSSRLAHQNELVVIPSIDLSEESSSEDGSDEEKKQNFVSSSSNIETRDIKTPRNTKEKAKSEPKKFLPRETRHSSRISEKGKPQKEDFQPLSVNVDEIEREKPYSPKITIKPIKEDEPNEDKEEHKGSLKITITKQSDNTHSILKMCSPDFEHRQKQSESDEQNLVPKLVIKTSDAHSDQHSPKTRSVKQSLPVNPGIRSGSPRITIKPIVKPDAKENLTSPLKITIKPIGKPEEFSRQQQKQSPKQVKNKSDDDHYGTRSKIMKTSDSSEVHSPKVTIKPVKPPEEPEMPSTPKITIKPIEKPEEARVSPKITIKPVVRPAEMDPDVEDEVKERIVLKINKGNLPSKDEKLAKIKLKFSKDGDAHIVHKEETESPPKRQHDFDTERSKRFKPDPTDSDDDVKLIENTQSPIVISEDSQSQDSVIIVENAKDPLAIVAAPQPQVPVVTPRKRGRPRKVPLVVREEFGTDKVSPQPVNIPSPVVTPEQPAETESRGGRPKRSCRAQSVRDTLGIKPRKPSKPRGGKRGGGAKSVLMKPGKEPGYSGEKIVAIKSLLAEEAMQNTHGSCLPTPSSVKVDEPIKPLGLKGLLEAAKDQNIIEVIEIDSPSNSPKRAESPEAEKIEEVCIVEEELLEKIGEPVGDVCAAEIVEIKEYEVRKDVVEDKEPSDFGGTDAAASDVEMQPPTPVFAPPVIETSAMDISSTTDIAMFEEETRMSADVSSRAQTPAKQVVSDVVVEESQSSIQSTATTESGKISRRSRLEVHQDQDGGVFTADQLNEYYWGGNGPFMIQEQVAQFLGIKSFKRKYPGIPRRMVDMQERDYIRENGLASEAMCDLGLTAVNSADILDIMYTDFQEKYEEFCRFQREKQAKDLLNKQKALALAANQEKNKLDTLEQAVQSAAAYNANFNKTRREQRRACMDLQTMNIHYPKGKLKKISMPKVGHYPVAVVPGQFTDYYKEFTPTELNNLPVNTMLYTELYKILPEVSDSESDSSASDSDDSSSSGSESNSSCEENCKMCEKRSVTPRKSPINSSV